MSTTEYRNLTADEVFFIFKEEHRLVGPLDPEANPSFDLQPTSTVYDWREARDLLKWDSLAKVFNAEYGIEISLEEWKRVLKPADQKTVMDVCELISLHAKIEVIRPIKLLGASCLSSAIFKSIKKNLHAKGIDTSSLSPSSKVEPFLKKNFGEFIALVNKNFTGVIPDIKEKITPMSKAVAYLGLITFVSLLASTFWDKMFVVAVIALLLAILLGYLHYWKFRKSDEMLTITGIVTFRDLVEKIVEVKYTSGHNQ
jgi:hypothetical protein